MIVDIIGAVLIGLLVGLIARFLLPGRDAMGCLATSLVGIAGSFVGGFVGRLIFGSPSGEYVRPGFLLSLVGAILVLLIVRMLRR